MLKSKKKTEKAGNGGAAGAFGLDERKNISYIKG